MVDTINYKTKLYELVDNMVDENLLLKNKINDLEINNSSSSKDYLENIENLNKEIKRKDKQLIDKDKELSTTQKVKHEYEVLINQLNEKIDKLIFKNIEENDIVIFMNHQYWKKNFNKSYPSKIKWGFI